MSQEKTCMGRLLRAEKMKYRRSGTDMLWYLLPVLTLAVAFVLSTTYGTVSAYNWWYVGMYPAMTGLAVLSGGRKRRKNGGQGHPSLLCPWRASGTPKVLTCILWMVKANILLALAVWITGNLIFPHLGMSQTLQVSCPRPGGFPCHGCGRKLAGAALPVPLAAPGYAAGSADPDGTYTYRHSGRCDALLEGGSLCILPRMMCVVIGVLPNNMPARPGQSYFLCGAAGSGQPGSGAGDQLALLVLLWCLSRRWYERKGATRV